MPETTEYSCSKCGQPLPQIMSCEEWEKAGQDLVRQVMQKGGLLKSGGFVS